MLSCKEPGGLFAFCSQGNFPLWGNFRASAGSTARDAAQGNPARLISFLVHVISLAAQNKCREGRRQNEKQAVSAACFLAKANENGRQLPPVDFI